MIIGLDIDNVITDFDKTIYSEMLKEDKNKRNSGIVNPDGRWIIDLFDWSKEEYLEFTKNNMQEFAKKFAPREGAKYYMDKLLKDGHDLILISNRVYPDYTTPYEVTVEWLNENKINYTKLVLSKTANKTIECIENNIDVMFDDTVINCQMLIKNNIRCYLMGTKYNIRYAEGLNIVNNWNELYEVVKKIEKELKTGN